MTSQQKRMIELSDLVAFCVTCKGCGVSLSIPALASVKDKRLERCPSCDDIWMTPITGSVRKFVDFKNALTSLRSSIEGGKADGFSLTLEIASDPVSTAKG